MQAVTNYFAEFSATLGAAWNRFWFTPRSATTLGLMRVLVGLIALYTIATYGPDLERWFGAGGMLPLDLVRGSTIDGEWIAGLFPGQWSLLDSVPTRMLWPVFYASLAVIALFAAGVGGRVTGVLATVATLSFFSRAPMVTGEFEPILAFLMIYLCIGRASDAFSVPALLKGRASDPQASDPQASSLKPQASPTNSIALRLLQIHVAIVHVMMGCAQLAAPESAWWNGEGIFLAATRPGMAFVDFMFLTDHPRVVAAWSHLITLYLLAFAPLVWNRWSRPLVLAAGVVIWISIALASGWTMFCLAMLVGLIAFVDHG